MQSRRDFLVASAAATAFGPLVCARAHQSNSEKIVTVTGPIEANELGMTLSHEHVLVDFVGADRVSPNRYDHEEAFQTILPFLKRAHELGCRALVECTPAYLGRNPKLLARLSLASGLRLLTNTGYYGAGAGKYLPPHAKTESADQLAERWLSEWKNGIDGTDVRPGFIKIGVDGGPLSAINRKLVQAAARTHLKSGLVIAGHTGDGRAALDQLELLSQEGVQGRAWIWVHAQSEKDISLHRKVAESGAWISLDGISPTSIDDHVRMVRNLKDAQLLDRVLISHDAGWYAVGEPKGGTFRSYETLFATFLPALINSGFSDAEIHQLTVLNPAKAFSMKVLKA